MESVDKVETLLGDTISPMTPVSSYPGGSSPVYPCDREPQGCTISSTAGSSCSATHLQGWTAVLGCFLYALCLILFVIEKQGSKNFTLNN